MTTKSAIQKCNRIFKKDEMYMKICKSRGFNAEHNLGEYYVLDTYCNIIIDAFIDPEDYLQKLLKDKSLIYDKTPIVL